MPPASFLHNLHPLTKVVWSLAVVTAAFFLQGPLPLLLLWASVLAVAGAGKVLRQVLPALKGLALLAGLFFLFQVFLIREGNTVFTLFPAKGIGQVTDVGLYACTVLALRMLAMTSTIPVLLATTNPKDMVVAFVEKLKVPYLYAFMLVTSLRFIPILQEQLDLVLQAQRARGRDLEGRNFIKRVKAVVPLALPLLLVSIRRSRTLAISLETRGFGSGPRTHLRPLAFRPADIAATAACLLLAFLVILL
ncbi:MAG TPA: energy-coupling factor transporter transmembrane protein EcfT [Peptococcaceae bacterium]|nr:MAG: Cobalt transport protein [Moorella sp. 60_41]HBT48079.1 energy-coupling factor transporter transmembrane protein EcfT [Peptococcaceae bacterium]